MKEIEVKILEINKEEVEKKLIELGAKKILDSNIHARIFDFDDDILENSNRLLRLRNEGDKFVLTFKEKISDKDAKINEETEVEVSDIEKMIKILNALDLKIKMEAKKHRTSYKIEGTRFEIDTPLEEFSHIPTYMEIEAKDVETIYKYAEIFGFTKEQCLPWGFSKLKDHYRLR